MEGVTGAADNRKSVACKQVFGAMNLRLIHGDFLVFFGRRLYTGREGIAQPAPGFGTLGEFFLGEQGVVEFRGEGGFVHVAADDDEFGAAVAVSALDVGADFGLALLVLRPFGFADGAPEESHGAGTDSMGATAAW
jgi:hypothetical protein